MSLNPDANPNWKAARRKLNKNKVVECLDDSEEEEAIEAVEAKLHKAKIKEEPREHEEVSEEATEETLHAAFVPFGDVKEVNIPRDFAGQTNDANRGFAFVTFELEGDAAEALYNMDGSELFGRVLRVNVARAMSHKLGSSKAVWSADSWFQESLTEVGVGKESGAAAVAPPGS